ncbi:MAG TPA: ATP phosphoribosyltransferase regulatory subunit, partial [Dehalococcoidia bacterium]|nr:ATP phosphoribosyltransferase regulatory subunit [Dehalococcoidia bacterium]
MYDLAPGDMMRFRHVEDVFRQVVTAWGYDEVRTPTLEYLHLFTEAGTLSPQMLRRVYSFLDWDGWSGERVVLRPDATIPVARLYAERFPPGGDVRLAYVENVFRFAEGDESREDWQCGVERLGGRAPEADLELILLGLELLERLQLPEPLVRVSHTGVARVVLAAAGLTPEEQLAHYDRILDGDLSALTEVEGSLPGLPLPLRTLFEVSGDLAFVTNLGASFGPAIPGMRPPLEELAHIARVLSALGRRYDIRMALARDFEYYTGAVFRFEAGGERMGGGGRYDALLRVVGGVDTPACGLALDVEPIVRLLPAMAIDRKLCVVRATSSDTGLMALAHEVAAGLREAGVVAAVNGPSGDGAMRVDVLASD